MLFQFTILAPDTIRLLRFQPYSTPRDIFVILEHQTKYFDRDVHYTAISYSHDDNGGKEYIKVNGRAFLVSSNLLAALSAILQHHRTSTEERFWVDAICINHRDLAERNDQVQQRWRISSFADRVLSWLGTESECTAATFQYVQYFSSAYSSTTSQGSRPGADSLSLSERSSEAGRDFEQCSSPPSKDVTAGLTEIQCNVYFQEAWTRADLIQAQAGIVICGSHQTNYAALHHCLSTTCPPVENDILWATTILQSRTEALSQAGSPTTPVKIFCSLVSLYANLSCIDHRDRIFAMLNDPEMRRLPRHSVFRVNYRLSAHEIFQLCSRYFDSLCQLDDHYHVDKETKDLVVHLARALDLSDMDSVPSRSSNDKSTLTAKEHI